MNVTELKAAALSDSHRENYTGEVDRFLMQAEAHIASLLQAYGLEYVLTDDDRDSIESPVYTLPARISFVRYLHGPEYPLDQVDESLIAARRASPRLECFCVRPAHIVVAGTPGAETQLQLDYMGLPAPLNDTNQTHALLTDYPHLYIDAINIFVFKRAQDYESMSVAERSVSKLIAEINRKVKKQLGGARSSNGYNVSFRSSY